MRFFSLLIFAIIAASTAGPTMTAQAKPPLQLAIKRQQFRQEYIKLDAFIDTLDIAGGMTILDIGAGPGYASFLFAEKLNGSGKVFATDIRADFVDYIAEEARKRGFSNLFPVVVKDRGLDDFYAKHRYDLVFLSNVYHCIDNRIEYFGKLRKFLNPNARLVVILYNQVSLFSEDDFSDFNGLVNSLLEDADDPFVTHLSSATKRLIKDKAGLKDPSKREATAGALVGDFNRMLTDPRFYESFYSNSYFKKDYFTPSERDLANWLLMSLKEEGVLERSVDQIDAKTLRTVIKLNRLFFEKRFGDYLADGGRGAYLPAGDANRQTSKYVMFRELNAAGYRFVKEIRLSPYFAALIMVPKSP
jgi:SAM-dependent methyltransferase